MVMMPPKGHKEGNLITHLFLKIIFSDLSSCNQYEPRILFPSNKTFHDTGRNPLNDNH